MGTLFYRRRFQNETCRAAGMRIVACPEVGNHTGETEETALWD